MKTLLILGFLFLNNLNCAAAAPKTVYVCNSSNAKRYHLKSDCRGLSNCSYKTIKTTLEKGKKEGKTLCKWED